MKKYRYYCEVSIGNESILETEMMKKAMVAFLKAFSQKPHISKESYDGLSKSDFYYLADVNFEGKNFLQVLRFAESLRAFCNYWNLPLDEHGLFEQSS